MKRRWRIALAFAAVLLAAVFLIAGCASNRCPGAVCKGEMPEHKIPAEQAKALIAAFPEKPMSDPEKVVKRKWQVAAGKNDGPSILLLHELPGMVPETLELADWLTKNGFRVYLPRLFGAVGERLRVKQLFFALHPRINPFDTNDVSPMARDLRGLVRAIRVDNPRQPVGVIGMCLTGNFVIELMPEEGVTAAVMSQPSLPFAVPWLRTALGVSGDEIAAAKASRVPIIGFHYECDKISPCARFHRYKEVFGDQMEAVDLKGMGHSALSIHASEEARAALLRFLKENVKTGPAAAR